MDFCGDLTAELWRSPRDKWVVGHFQQSLSNASVMVATDRKGTVLKFRSCEVAAGGVSDSGTIGVVEVTGGPLYNVRFYFPDGTSSKGKRHNELALADKISFTADGQTCIIETSDGKSAQVNVNALSRGPVRNAVVAVPKKGCLSIMKVVLLLAFAALLLLLGAKIITR